MPIFFILAILFLSLPLVEIAIFIEIKNQTNTASVIGLVVITAVIGAALARQQGISTLRELQRKMASGQLPTDELLDGILILIASAVLLTPGLITDAFGFSLLIPGCRKVWRGIIKRKIKLKTVSTMNSSGFGFHSSNHQSKKHPDNNDIIDVEGEFINTAEIEDKNEQQ